MTDRRSEAQREKHREATARSERRMLTKLAVASRPLTVREAADAFRCSRQYAWRLLARLTSRGAVTRGLAALEQVIVREGVEVTECRVTSVYWVARPLLQWCGKSGQTSPGFCPCPRRAAGVLRGMAKRKRLRLRVRGPLRAIRLGTWTRVPTDAVDMAHVRGQLSMRNPEFWMRHENGESTEGLEPIIKLYRGGGADDTYVWLPRHFQPVLTEELDVVPDDRTYPTVPKVSCTVQPRNHIQQRAMEAFSANQDGILCLAPGVGKAQPLDEKVLTPHGWTTMGELRVGDFVVGSDGAPTRVTGVFPQGSLPVYRVTFTDGGSTRACGDHLWAVRTHYLRTKAKSKPPQVISTRGIVERGVVSSDGRREFSVSYVKPVAFAPNEDLPLDPYTLGAWIGDGSSTKTTAIFHNPEGDVVARFGNGLPLGDTLVKVNDPDRCPAFRVRRQHFADSQKKFKASAFLDVLRKLGLAGRGSHQRFIPPQYLTASVNDRVRLLQGLMDTDGHVANAACLDYFTTSEELKGGIVELVQSLGGRVTWVVKKTHYVQGGIRHPARTGYRLTISFPTGQVTPVSSKKHLAKWGGRPSRTIERYIDKVEMLPGKYPCACISVEAEDSQYVTSDYVLTHNTLTSLMIAAKSQRFPLLVVVHTTALLDQWRKEISRAYGIGEEEIGIVRGPRCDYIGRTVSVAMLQSLAQKKYSKAFYAHWRCVVLDEVHRAGSYTWSSVVHHFPGQRIGLTATPDRPDGMDKAFRVHIGRIRYKYTRQPLKADFVFVHTGIRFHAPAIRNPIRRWAMVMSRIGASAERNEIISLFLKKIHKEGRRVIVLGERVKTLQTLYQSYPGKDKSMFIAAVAQEDRREALQASAIFATSSMAKEGLDVPSLDTLVITIPFSGLGRLEQSVGRILRTYEGKQQPRVYVFVDDQPTCFRNAEVQKEWARSKEYKITEIYRGEYDDHLPRERPAGRRLGAEGQTPRHLPVAAGRKKRQESENQRDDS